MTANRVDHVMARRLVAHIMTAAHENVGTPKTPLQTTLTTIGDAYLDLDLKYQAALRMIFNAGGLETTPNRDDELYVLADYLRRYPDSGFGETPAEPPSTLP